MTASGTTVSEGAAPDAVAGRNGVVVPPSPVTVPGFRSYEVYQRQRVSEPAAPVRPRQLLSDELLRDPYPVLAALRETEPCYRDWIGNAFWLTRYDDVTSVFVDDANFTTRTTRSAYGLDDAGRDLGDEPAVQACAAAHLRALARPVAEELVAALVARGGGDLAIDLAARFPLELLTRTLGLPPDEVPVFVERYLRMQRGASWEPRAEVAGRAAVAELTTWSEALLRQRRADPGEDLLSVLAGLEPADGPVTGADVVATLLEADHQTLHGALANTCLLLLTHPDQLAQVSSEHRHVTSAYLEALRHSPPVQAARRHTRHEVERFGRLLPEGALVVCSAAAANRDPRQFRDPDTFDVGRRDLCRREPRGMYRADGLASGIAFGLGPPSRHPAQPEDRPPSRYAQTRDAAVTALTVLLEQAPDLRLEEGAQPVMRSLRLGDMWTCWSLPVVVRPGGTR